MLSERKNKEEISGANQKPIVPYVAIPSKNDSFGAHLLYRCNTVVWFELPYPEYSTVQYAVCWDTK